MPIPTIQQFTQLAHHLASQDGTEFELYKGEESDNSAAFLHIETDEVLKRFTYWESGSFFIEVSPRHTEAIESNHGVLSSKEELRLEIEGFLKNSI